MQHGTEVGLAQATLCFTDTQLPQKGNTAQFLAPVYCGQMAGWIKVPLGMEVCLGPDHIYLFI